MGMKGQKHGICDALSFACPSKGFAHRQWQDIGRLLTIRVMRPTWPSHVIIDAKRDSARSTLVSTKESIALEQ